MKPRSTQRQVFRDLGFGSVVADETRRRLLNRDGSFNVTRTGLGWRSSLSLFHPLLDMSWPRFLSLFGVVYLAINALFALGYMAIGPGSLGGALEIAAGERFSQAFFLSVQTISTVGYGQVVPVGTAALLMTLESLVGLLIVALATGLVFARFSRPHANIQFSRNALVAPYGEGRALQFRIANRRKSQIIELEAKVILSLVETVEGRKHRRFYDLALERQKVTFFPLSWTIVHPLDEESPLRDLDAETCLDAEVEILVLLTGTDETFSQRVHARSSYRAEEIIWDARFTRVFQQADDQRITLDVRRIHDHEPLAGPREVSAA